MPGAPLTEPISPAVLTLITEAVSGRLAICAGVGLSVGSDLPSGSQLAHRIHDQFEGRVVGYRCPRADDLVAVATAVASLPAGLEALQRSIVDLAPFDGAPPTLGHRLLALLIAEGAVRMLTTNWDDCLERGWTDERILAARDASEAEELLRPHVLKIHGCCTRPATLLVTEDQLRAPPLWTRGFFRAEIERSTMVFVGIGDVAPYVRDPINELADYVDGARIRVVSPGIVERWDASEWRTVLPNLAEERRLAKTADAFADELARGWLGLLLRELDRSTRRERVSACRDAFAAMTAVQALSWLRRAADGWAVGESIVRSAEAPAALKAIAELAIQHAADIGQELLPAIRFKERATVTIGEQLVEVLLSRPNQPTSEVERAARRRAESIASELGVDYVTVLCAASMPEGPRRSTLDAQDVFAGEPAPDDLISGPTQVAVRLLWADRLLEVA
jgi:hypothetical protein